MLLLLTATSAFAEDRYVLTLGLRQSRFSLNPFSHMKDAINETEFQIPVDKKYFDSVKVGDKLSDKFRTGSLILRGSFSSWEVKVKSKNIVKE